VLAIKETDQYFTLQEKPEEKNEMKRADLGERMPTIEEG
jgi:hypothetical protein